MAEKAADGKLGSFLKDIAAPFLDFLFPARCPVCGDFVGKNGEWCGPCLAKTIRVRQLPLNIQHRHVLSEAWAFGMYQGPLRDLLLPIKFKNRRDGLAYITSFLKEAGGYLPRAGWMPGIAVPVPLFAAKERLRGGNQTEMIFHDWLSSQGWMWRRALVRTRATAPQFGLSSTMRASNIKDAFALSAAVDPHEIEGNNILLVDDILTTGSTLFECARVLQTAGAANVIAWVLASDRC